jgi:hypothetical protein
MKDMVFGGLLAVGVPRPDTAWTTTNTTTTTATATASASARATA